MPVPMMAVGVMGVAVAQRRMAVQVAMARIGRVGVNMAMMRVFMGMGVLVLGDIVLVVVFVAFGQVQP